MKRRALLLMAAAATGCGGQSQPQAQAPPPPVEEPVTQLPAQITGPHGDTVDVSGDSAVIVYLWLPLVGHQPTERDLRTLAQIAGTGSVRTLPIQLDGDSRNAAQTQINELGLVMPVYLADSSIMQCMEHAHLPSALLLTPGGQRCETGFGSPSRLLLGDGAP